MIYCDVCDSLLEVSGRQDLDEDVKIICPECGFDNTYQLSYNELSDEVFDFLDATDIIDDDILLDALAERFGSNRDELKELINEKEMLGWDIRIRRK